MSSKGELREKTKLFPITFSTFNIIVTLYVQKLSKSRVRNAVIKINEMQILVRKINCMKCIIKY